MLGEQRFILTGAIHYNEHIHFHWSVMEGGGGLKQLARLIAANPINILEIHACSNPSPLTKSMQLYFRNYMKYFNRLLS